MTTYTDPAKYWQAVNDYNNYQGNTNWTNSRAGMSYPILAAQPKTAAAPAPAAGTAAAAPAAAAPDTSAADRAKAIEDAITGGGSYLSSHLADTGYNAADQADITKRFNDYLNPIAAGIPQGTTNVGSYYNYGDLFNKSVTDETGQQRNTIQAAYQTATPYGWQQSAIPDTLDDPVLKQLLGEQATGLQDTLQRKLDRGQMSQGAYDYALGQLGYDPGGNYTGLSAGAYSNLQNLGGGVLASDRTGLNDISSDFQNRITNFKLGDILNPDVFNTNVQNRVGEYQGRMRGDIMAALGNTQLFDPNALIAKAGSAAGPSNSPIGSGNAQGTGLLQEEDDPRNRVTSTSGTF